MDHVKSVLDEKVQKAMSAGAGYANAPATRTGGEAMSKESLDCKPKKMLSKKIKKDKNYQKLMLKSLIEVACGVFPQEDPKEVADLICKSYELKLKEFTEC